MPRWRVQNRNHFILVFLTFLLLNSVLVGGDNSREIVHYNMHVNDTLYHNESSWTQGFLIHDGYIFESTGINGKSSLQKINISTGDVEQSFFHNESIFGEGLAYYDSKLIQLTYVSNVAFVFDLESFEIINTFNYSGEGWGLCTMPNFFVMSNGTNQLSIRDLDTFELIDVINVTKNGTPLRNLNELECVGDIVYSNVWLSNEIVMIDLITGNVTNIITDDGVLNRTEYNDANVLNGIAYDVNNSEFWITGKYWPYFYQVSFELNEEKVTNNSTNSTSNINEIENNNSHTNEDSNFFNSDIFSYSVSFLILICFLIWIIDIKLRAKIEKTQVQGSSEE